MGLFDFATIMSELDSLRNTLEFNKNDKIKVAVQFLIPHMFIIQMGEKIVLIKLLSINRNYIRLFHLLSYC